MMAHFQDARQETPITDETKQDENETRKKSVGRDAVFMRDEMGARTYQRSHSRS